MTDTPEFRTPEVALAVYAASAATIAIKHLREAGLITEKTLNDMTDSVIAIRGAPGLDPRIERHLQEMTALLLK